MYLERLSIMVTQWSDNIAVAELQDEPLLSEDLAALSERMESAGSGQPHLVLNFSGVTYIGSANLGQLLKLRRLLAESGRKLRLCMVSDEIRSLFSVTGVDRLFAFSPDPLTALAGLQLEEDAGG
jgi:anti-anti-sigma factor